MQEQPWPQVVPAASLQGLTGKDHTGKKQKSLQDPAVQLSRGFGALVSELVACPPRWQTPQTGGQIEQTLCSQGGDTDLCEVRALSTLFSRGISHHPAIRGTKQELHSLQAACPVKGILSELCFGPLPGHAPLL